MSYAAVLAELGFAPDQRVVVFSADDFGLCESSLTALEELADFGLVSSASVMVPCPWFPAAADWARQHPEFSVGVHLTLTSEWESYRWPPLAPQSSLSGLVDQHGYLHQQRQAVIDNASPENVALELQTQVQRALQHGIDVTHIDSHMYTALRLPFLYDYLALQQLFEVPVVLWPLQGRPAIGMQPEELAEASQAILVLVEQQRAFQLKQQLWTRMAPPAADLDTVKRMLSQLKPGLTRFYIHPAKDSPELRRIVPDWQCRVADYEVFMSKELRRFMVASGIQSVSYRQLRDTIRQLNNNM